MGAEDFAFMLEAKPGAYIWLGAGKLKPAECCITLVMISMMKFCQQEPAIGQLLLKANLPQNRVVILNSSNMASFVLDSLRKTKNAC